MLVGVPIETTPGERRVALVPATVKQLAGIGVEVVVQSGAGKEAGFLDGSYADAGAHVESEEAVVYQAEVVLKVQPPRSRERGEHEVDYLKDGGYLIGFLRPLDLPGVAGRLARRNVTSFAMELMPRVTRAQSMDALSAMSTIAGYRAVLLGASALPKMFPMMVTAAGTLSPARVLVIGAGVAGLQAIATARRLGAVVEAYDTRPVVKEQVESLGARFVELALDTQDAEAAGGYAKAQTEDFYNRQRELLGKHVASSDVVITTALVPGQRAPILIEESSVEAMRPGSVIVDLASDLGGNCAVTEPGHEIVRHGVTIIGATNIASSIPVHASQMYSKNLSTFLKHLVKDGAITLDLEDEITRGALLTHEGHIVHEGTRARAEAEKEADAARPG